MNVFLVLGSSYPNLLPVNFILPWRRKTWLYTGTHVPGFPDILHSNKMTQLRE